MRILSAQDVASLAPQLTPDALMLMSARLFLTLSSPPRPGDADEPPRVQMPLRTSLQMTNHKMLVMPARIVGQKAMAAVKVVGATLPHASEHVKAAGLPATTMVFNEETGVVDAVINASSLTAIRSGAGSALATSMFANPEAKKLVIFGSGAQAEWHARLIAPLLRRLQTLVFVVRSPTSAKERAFLNRMAEVVPLGFESPVAVRVVASAEGDDEIRDADVICTCTPSITPLFDTARLASDKPVHINAIGSYTPHMHEFDLAPLLRPVSTPPPPPRLGPVVVDNLAACRSEAGELVSATSSSLLDWSSVFEIGNLIAEQGAVDAGKLETYRRERPGNVSLFKAVGVGAQDVAIAQLVLFTAEKLGVGVEVPF